MKSLKIISAMALGTLMFTSCVSSKKYTAAVNNNEELKRQNQQLSQQLAAETSALADANSRARLKLTQTKNDLNSTEAELAAREKRLAELEEIVKEQGEAVALLHQEVCSALKCFTPDELTVDVREGKLYVSMSDKLLFESGSDQLNDRGKEAIGMLSDVLANSDLEVMVEGHTDNIPISSSRNKDNWDLSVHRATSVTRIMMEEGIAPERIIACGRGEYQPIAKNADADGRRLNRRTEIVLAPKLDKLWKLAEEDYNVTAESNH